MTHISKQPLQSKRRTQLEKQFVNFLASISKQQAEPLFTDLFTEAERTMFIKRLAAVLMLHEGYSRYRIARTLHLSQSTVKIFALHYEQGLYAGVLSVSCSKAFDSYAFWELIETLLQAGMPAQGRSRWSGMRKRL